MAVKVRIEHSRWHTLVANRAREVFPDGRVRVSDIAQAMDDEDLTKITDWLRGTKVPATQQEHDALMRALGLEAQMLDIPKNISSPNVLQAQLRHQMRLQIVEAWPNRPPQAKGPLQPRPKLSHREFWQCLKDHGKPTEWYPGFPERLRPQRDYAQMDPEALDDVLRTTMNAHEFIAAFRRRYYGQHLATSPLIKSVAHNQTTLRAWEDGQSLPGNKYNALKQLVAGNAGEAMAERFEDVVIGNRLAIAHSAGGSDQHQQTVASDHLSFLPPRYWRCVLQECAVRHGKEAAPTTQPFWAEDIFPIHSRGDYLRAMRTCHFGRDTKTLSLSLGLTHTHYRHFETDKSLLSPERVEIAATQLPGFDRELYEALPVVRQRAAAVIEQRAAARNNNGRG